MRERSFTARSSPSEIARRIAVSDSWQAAATSLIVMSVAALAVDEGAEVPASVLRVNVRVDMASEGFQGVWVRVIGFCTVLA